MTSKIRSVLALLTVTSLLCASFITLGEQTGANVSKARSAIPTYSEDTNTVCETDRDVTESKPAETAKITPVKDTVNQKAVSNAAAVLTEQGIINEKAVTLDGSTYDISTVQGAIDAMLKIQTSEDLKRFAFLGLENVFMALLNVINSAIPMPQDIIPEDNYVSENFYSGHDSFVKNASDGASWSLGYAQASLVPDDVFEKNYYLGGYLLQNFPSNTVETILDDMKVRCIVLDDGRGKVVFATIDSIGIANADVRRIRAAVENLYSGSDIVAVNIFTTHCHSCIDTQGLWNPFFLKIANNYIASSTGALETISGPDEAFMQLLIDRTAAAITNACNTMEKGKLYVSSIDIPEYIDDNRSPDCKMTELNRLRFVPNDPSVSETYIANMAAHPYITGLKTDNSSGKELSGDYVYYAEEIVNKAGYNYMFINGAISGIYSARGLTGDGIPAARRSDEATRYGNEIGRMLLSITLTKDEILAKPDWWSNKTESEAQLLEGNTNYTTWYENWLPASESGVEPILNVRLKEVLVPVTNPVLQAVGKLSLANNEFISRSDGSLCTVSEIGYLELGKNIKTVLVPGEFNPELITGGGSMDAENSCSGTAYEYPSYNKIISDKLGYDVKLLAFGEANDGCGYVIPDNDYLMIFFDDDEFFGNHYQETISYGKHTASAYSKAFIEMVDGIS